MQRAAPSLVHLNKDATTQRDMTSTNNVYKIRDNVMYTNTDYMSTVLKSLLKIIEFSIHHQQMLTTKNHIKSDKDGLILME